MTKSVYKQFGSFRQHLLLMASGSLIAAMAFLTQGCGGDDAAVDAQPVDHINLGIADRAWSPGHDDVGWCGETCIQMAMGYYGREVSQEEINRAAGSPSDITEVDMSIALDGLGVTWEAWDESIHDVGQFIEWIKTHLRNGHPVICGTKIYPDEHPEWYVDHFVLAVGFDSTGLLVNTQLDCDGQLLLTYDQLASMDPDYAFQDSSQRYFGRAIIGVR